jgi:hypothetical protein
VSEELTGQTAQTRYSYIHFTLSSSGENTSVWVCRNNRDPNMWLGFVKWYAPWRQYCFLPNCFLPTDDMVFSAGCLDDVSDFLRRVNQEHKKRRSGDHA